MDLTLTLSQKLTLSQRMLQSAEILQMSSQELVEYMKELSVENPVVEYEEPSEARERLDTLKRKLEWLEAADEQNKTYYRQEKDESAGTDLWNFREAASESLEEHLKAQLAVLDISKTQRALGEYIIESMDANGYLDENIADMAVRLEVAPAALADALQIVRGLDPMGVGAQNLSECLRIQVERLGIDNPLVLQIIESELPTLGKNQLHTIAKRHKVSLEEVIDAVSLIKTLNPKPGNSFANRRTLEYITPDVIVAKSGEGYEIILNDYFFPRLSISNYYKSIINDDTADSAKEYVCDKIKQAEWAMKCISKRNATLVRTLEVIIDLQRSFFDHGPGHLRPMRLYDVAERIGMHESTVSRAVRDKYLQCSWGVFPLSAFFPIGVSTHNAAQNDGAREVTPAYIKSQIQEIIDGEDKSAPYSDRVITEMLNQKGITISRRTVTKYRESMNILGIGGRKAYG